jgi:arylsulfatase A-like enzyme
MGEPLNVLLIVLEGARVDHLSAAGEPATTPFLEQVAREGVRFPHAFTSAPASVPAVASMLTGLFASLHGATEETRALGPAPRLLPELLRAAGYRTAAFCPHPAISPQNGFGRGFDRFYTQRVGGRIAGRAADYARRASDRVLGRGDAGARRTTYALLDWLSASPEPFFAFVHFREPLRPLRPPAPYDRTAMPAGLTAAQARAANQPGDDTARPVVSADETAALAALHDGALRYVDLRLRQIADALAAGDRWERTLFIVTASYGEDLGERGSLGGPASLCDATLRVPLLLRCPGRIPAGFVVDEVAQPVDLLPTIAALSGCPLDAPVQGRALLTASGASTGPRAVLVEAFRPLASALASAGDPLDTVRRKVIRTRREKLVWRSDEANALYDLAHDPDERENIAEQHPERVDRLRRALFDWLADGERWGAAHGLPAGEVAGVGALRERRAGE